MPQWELAQMGLVLLDWMNFVFRSLLFTQTYGSDKWDVCSLKSEMTLRFQL